MGHNGDPPARCITRKTRTGPIQRGPQPGHPALRTLHFAPPYLALRPRDPYLCGAPMTNTVAIRCPECGTSLEEPARPCPHCGAASPVARTGEGLALSPST